MYHHINPKGDFINVKPEIFERHILHLKKQGFTALSTDELLSVLEGKQAPPERPVMITFDDGWLDNWLYAFPILKKYKMKAVIFVVTSWIHEQGIRQRADEGNTTSLPEHKECQKRVDAGYAAEVMLSWEEMREMEASGLIDIQSHTHSHKRLDKLYNDSMEIINVLSQELIMSKNLIEGKLGKQCNALCWPWGRYDEDYIRVAQSAGYKMIFTIEKGTNNPTTDPMRIKRLVIGNISSFSLRKKLFIHSRDWLSKVYLQYFK